MTCARNGERPGQINTNCICDFPFGDGRVGPSNSNSAQAHKTSTLCKSGFNWEGSTYMQYRLDDYARRHLACTVHKYLDDGESEASFPTATGGP